GVDELCEFAAGGALPPNPVAITFDDGYRDNYEQALPILRRNSCKAIFFVATSFIDERRLYWWDTLAYLIKQSRRAMLELTYPRTFRLPLSDPKLAISALLRVVKTCPALDMDRLLEELSRATDVAWSRELER